MTLSAGDSVFSLEFVALHYAAPQRNQFAYQLEGFDEGWVSTDASKRFATYTNLDPGQYTFRVKAANKDGVWNASGATLSITILPPWWKTWWFRTGALLLVGLSTCVSGVFHALVGDCAARRRCSNARWARARSKSNSRTACWNTRRASWKKSGATPSTSAPRPSSAAPTPSARRKKCSARRKKSSRPTAIFRCCPRSGAN
ncbi:hypothetical protein LP419_07710 [Massilia sp. H-1]|nr:hypothetical protein LP419_07710 [Massilia sp. H-1]